MATVRYVTRGPTMRYREFRSLVDPGYHADKDELEVLTIEISHAHVMKRVLEAGFRDQEQDAEWGEDNRDLPSGFLHNVIQAVFEAAGEALDEAFEDAIEDAAEQWGLHRKQAEEGD